MPAGKIFNIQKFSINDGPGIRTTVFFKGCPLRCRWCSNPESQNRFSALADALNDEKFAGKTCTVDDVLRVVLQDRPFYEQSGGGMTLSGGEPLQQWEFAIALLDAARAEKIHTAVETTGMANPEIFQTFLKHVDLLLFDVKHYDREAHFEGTGVYNDQILANLSAALAAKKPLIARIPVIPRFNATLPFAEAMAKKLTEMGVREVNLLPFHQFGESKYDRLGVPYEMASLKQLHPENLETYRDAFLRRGLRCTFG